MRRRARKRDARGSASGAQIAARVAVYGGLCAYCGKVPYQDIDHVVALIRGGTNWPANLRPSCKRCNVLKAEETWTKVTFGSPVPDFRRTQDDLPPIPDQDDLPPIPDQDDDLPPIPE